MRVSAILVLMLGACGAGDNEDATAELSTWGPLAVRRGEGSPAEARIEGDLIVGSRCVFLDTGGDRFLLIWPEEKTAWDADAHEVIFGEPSSGRLRLGNGHHVAFSGGGWALGDQDSPPPGEALLAPIDPSCSAGQGWFIGDLILE